MLLTAACGRLGYDAAIDAIPVCPSDTTEIIAGSQVCIERAQRGNLTWTNSVASCNSLGRRLCTDMEWYTACINASGLTNMTGDSYEWVAEMSNGIGSKRGASGCTDMSSHEIYVDPYGYRCCVDK